MSPNPPIPSICDGLWLSLYPASYLGIVLLARRHWRGIPAGVWLDGIVAGPRRSRPSGPRWSSARCSRSATGSAGAVATNLAYPVARPAARRARRRRARAAGLAARPRLGAARRRLPRPDGRRLHLPAAGRRRLGRLEQRREPLLHGRRRAARARGLAAAERSELPRTDGLSTLLVPGRVRPGRGRRAGVRPLQAARRAGLRARAR